MNTKTKLSTNKVKLKENKVKPKRMCYSAESVQLALQEIREGKSVLAIANKYKIPRTTLIGKRDGLYANKKPGPATVLNAEEENELVQWILLSSQQGFPVTKAQLLESVKNICIRLKKKNTFTNSTPGKAWYKGFLRRHPEISFKKSENISLNQTEVTDCSLREWFKEIEEYLPSQNALHIEPARVFSCDETAMCLNPESPCVQTLEGEKNVQKIVNNNEKQNVTVFITANAEGTLAPILVLFAGKSLPKNTTKMAPKNFAFGFSDNGLMLTQNFFDYVANVFEPWLTIENIQRPVILYTDAHSSQLTLQLSKFCSSHGIILIALYSNASHIIQPLDITFFKSLKETWQNMSQKFCQDTFCVSIQKYQFAPLLQKTLDSMDLKNILINGFMKCGLCPFNIEAIDFNKVAKKFPEDNICVKHASNEVLNDFMQNIETRLKVFESFLSDSQLKNFEANQNSEWKGLEQDKSLFKIWRKLKYADNSSTSKEKNATWIGPLINNGIILIDASDEFPSSPSKCNMTEEIHNQNIFLVPNDTMYSTI